MTFDPNRVLDSANARWIRHFGGVISVGRVAANLDAEIAELYASVYNAPQKPTDLATVTSIFPDPDPIERMILDELGGKPDLSQISK